MVEDEGSSFGVTERTEGPRPVAVRAGTNCSGRVTVGAPAGVDVLSGTYSSDGVVTAGEGEAINTGADWAWTASTRPWAGVSNSEADRAPINASGAAVSLAGVAWMPVMA